MHRGLPLVTPHFWRGSRLAHDLVTRWWRSFFTSGSSALWMYIYGIYYFSVELQIEKFVSTLMYFGYNFIVCLGFALVTGTVGVIACYCFVHKIYGSIKVD